MTAVSYPVTYPRSQSLNSAGSRVSVTWRSASSTCRASSTARPTRSWPAPPAPRLRKMAARRPVVTTALRSLRQRCQRLLDEIGRGGRHDVDDVILDVEDARSAGVL